MAGARAQHPTLPEYGPLLPELGGHDIRGTCTSNAMTPTEGALGLALVGGGLLLLGALSLPKAPRVVPE